MNTLQACLELDFSKINFLERKQRITHPKTIVVAPPRSGKSYLVYDYLSGFNVEEYLYIDLDDFKNSYEDLEELDSFIKTNNIKVLAIENYTFDMKLPNCDSIVLTTNENETIFGFKNLYLMPLDFEEYLLHDQRHQNEISSFNAFYKYGNLPGVINLEEHKKEKRLQEVIKIYTKDETEQEVLQLLFLNIDEKKSINQLFTTLKKRLKISKDRFYELCKYYEHAQMIFFIEKFEQSKAVKKIYSYNHAFLNALTHTKKFKNQFTNMVFLELHKGDEEIFYYDSIDFYLPESNRVILCHPFFNKMLMNTHMKKVYTAINHLDVDEIFIITIGNEDSFSHNTINISVLPFYEWSLS